MREVLDDASTRMDDRFQDAPEVFVDLHNTFGYTYFLLGEYVVGEAHLAAALASAEVEFGPSDPRTLEIVARLGHTLLEQDRVDEAESLLRGAIGRLPVPEPEMAMSVREALARVLHRRGRSDDAIALYRQVHARSWRGTETQRRRCTSITKAVTSSWARRPVARLC